MRFLPESGCRQFSDLWEGGPLHAAPSTAAPLSSRYSIHCDSHYALIRLAGWVCGGLKDGFYGLPLQWSPVNQWSDVNCLGRPVGAQLMPDLCPAGAQWEPGQQVPHLATTTPCLVVRILPGCTSFSVLSLHSESGKQLKGRLRVYYQAFDSQHHQHWPYFLPKRSCNFVNI